MFVSYTTDGERELRLVALIVAQHIGEPVGTLLVEHHDATVEARVYDGQAHALFAI